MFKKGSNYLLIFPKVNFSGYIKKGLNYSSQIEKIIH